MKTLATEKFDGDAHPCSSSILDTDRSSGLRESRWMPRRNNAAHRNIFSRRPWQAEARVSGSGGWRRKGKGEVGAVASGVLVGWQQVGEEGRSFGYAPRILGVRARASSRRGVSGRWKKTVARVVAGLDWVSCKWGRVKGWVRRAVGWREAEKRPKCRKPTEIGFRILLKELVLIWMGWV